MRDISSYHVWKLIIAGEICGIRNFHDVLSCSSLVTESKHWYSIHGCKCLYRVEQFVLFSSYNAYPNLLVHVVKSDVKKELCQDLVQDYDTRIYFVSLRSIIYKCVRYKIRMYFQNGRLLSARQRQKHNVMVTKFSVYQNIPLHILRVVCGTWPTQWKVASITWHLVG